MANARPRGAGFVLAGPAAAETVRRGIVSAVIDGDTVTLAGGGRVRLVGIQAPKLSLGRAGFRDWPLAAASKSGSKSWFSTPG